MKFGVNALFLIPGEVGGTETYVRRTLPPLAARLAPHEELVVFANAENRDALAADGNKARRMDGAASRGAYVVRLERPRLRRLQPKPAEPEPPALRRP